MNFALLSVSIGNLLTLAQVLGLRILLDTNGYVAFRTVINTSNSLVPFMCLGFDAAAPRLTGRDKNHPFFWNLLAFHASVFILALASCTFFAADSKYVPIILGVGMSTFLSASVAISNFRRSEGNFFRYFLNMNITEKALRTAAILGCAALLKQLNSWYSATTVLYTVALVIRLCGINIRPQFDLKIFRLNIKQALPFFLSSMAIVVLTRLPYFVSYFFRPPEETARLDIVLLFSLFILIPYLNRSKIDEVQSDGNPYKFVQGLFHSRRTIFMQELLIVAAMIGASAVGVVTNRIVAQEITQIVLPSGIGMILISSALNPVQLLAFSGKVKHMIVSLVSLFIFCAFIYKVAVSNIGISLPQAFAATAAAYWALAYVVTCMLDIESSYTFRFEHAMYNIIVLSAGCNLAAQVFHRYNIQLFH